LNDFPPFLNRNPRKAEEKTMAEGVGFEPTVELPLLLISSQVPLTTQPPFQLPIFIIIGSRPISWKIYARFQVAGKLIQKSPKTMTE
jgi:hypothetical protein